MERRTLLASLPTLLGAAPPSLPPLRGLSRTNLLEYRDAQGRIRQGSTRAHWERRRDEAIAAMRQVTGPLPGPEKRTPLAVAVQEETDMGSYVRRAITYASEPNSLTTAYLCLPKSALAGRPAPAVLCLHPTDNTVGYKVVVGLGGRPHRQYAAELAERGFVTISPSYVQLAEYQPDLDALGYVSGTMKAIWDNVRALDLLDALPEVRKGAYAAIGHSLGGHNAIYTAVHDQRVKVIVSSCGFDSFLDYYGGNIKGWVQARYMLRMGQYLGHPENVPFDFYELIAALAPRALFVNAPLRDANFRHDSVDRIFAAARPIYGLYNEAGNLRVEHPDSDHDFPDPVRFAAYDWIARRLPR
ncbi:MAG TPA: dienelactone hydrolase family protein [Bryobacteraceae bacterium]|nr:dienelactone hydrolase family protein [Bryobacteraceae bacterium]